MSGMAQSPKRVLGIDVGTAIVGWGVVEQRQNKLYPIAYGTITTSKADPDYERLAKIYQELIELIAEFHPQEAAVESLFYFKNQKTVMTVSQARGVILLALQHQSIFQTSYTPLQAKTAITGYGRADKQQMQQMVQTLLRLDEIPQPDDAADALALAITHLHNADYQLK